MKKFLFLIGFIGTLSYAQEFTDNSSPEIAKNEVTVNLPLTVFAKFPSVGYEYLYSKDFGFGGNAGVSIGDDNLDFGFGYQITPFARWYFLSSGNETIYGRRFFIEANTSIFKRKDSNDQNNATENKNKSIEAGLGMALGYKYVNSSNWVGSIYYGAGRSFTSDSSVSFYPQFGINIGKRF